MDIYITTKLYHILYKTINIINNKEYVGVHSTNNLNDGYLGSGKKFKAALRKYGKENFKRTILKIFKTPEEAYFAESKIVTEEYLKRQDVYNINVGGLMSYHTEESKKKISDAKKGIKFKEYHKQKLSEAKIGTCGELNPFHGKHHTEDTKKSISKSVRNLERIECEFCKRLIHPCQFNKYHGISCKLNPNWIDTRKECPHCGIKTNDGNYTVHHGDNCKYRFSSPTIG